MREGIKNLETGDRVVTTPGQMVADNEDAGLTNTTTPDKQALEDEEGNLCEVTATGFKHTNNSGHTLELNANDGITHTVGGRIIQISAVGGIVIINGIKRTELSILQLLHDNGAGLTNSITDEEMVIAGDGKLATYEGDSVALSDGSGEISIDTVSSLQAAIGGGTLSAKPEGVVMELDGSTAELTPENGLSLDDGEGTSKLSVANGLSLDDGDDNTADLTAADGLDIEQGDDFVKVTPAGGLDAQAEDYKAKVSPAAGVHLEDSGGASTVDIATQSGKVITLRETDLCENVAGVATAKHGFVLRAEAEV